jgi:hypothetical protein
MSLNDQAFLLIRCFRRTRAKSTLAGPVRCTCKVSMSEAELAAHDYHRGSDQQRRRDDQRDTGSVSLLASANALRVVTRGAVTPRSAQRVLKTGVPTSS